MSKRTAEEEFLEEFENTRSSKQKRDYVKKHTLDSDEEDDSVDEERYNIMNENDIEGEEDGIAGMDGEVKLTPFNMKEELEEGHFDADGHYQWNKDDNIKDNWLDNLDWVKIKNIDKKDTKKDDSDSDSDAENSSGANKFDAISSYRRILELMRPKETIKKTLQRLGSTSAKLSSSERWKMKKAGIIDPNVELVTELTELTNRILTEMGNMDIYEETYEMISIKYASKTTTGLSAPASATVTSSADDSLDMYADDFDTKEKSRITTTPIFVEPAVPPQPPSSSSSTLDSNNDIKWEFKWKLEDDDIHGPFSTQQMQQWVEEGYFKDGVMVKKYGQQADFHTSKRIDFELYL